VALRVNAAQTHAGFQGDRSVDLFLSAGNSFHRKGLMALFTDEEGRHFRQLTTGFQSTSTIPKMETLTTN
jgi:hypothetical protein